MFNTTIINLIIQVECCSLTRTKLVQSMSVSRILQYTFLHELLYLYQLQYMIQHVMPYWVTCRYNNVHVHGNVKQNISQTWTSSRSNSIHVLSACDVTSYYRKVNRLPWYTYPTNEFKEAKALENKLKH